MTTVTWVNSAGGDWATAADWSSGTIPDASADVAIDSFGTTAPYVITVSAGEAEAAHSLTLDSGNATLEVAGTLAVGTTIAIDAGLIDVGSGGILDGGTIVAGSSDLIVDGGTLDHVTIEGGLTIGNDESAFVLNGLTVTGLGGTGPGTIAVSGEDSALIFQNSQTLDNTTLTISGFSDAVRSGANTTSNTVVLTLGRGVITDLTGSAAQLDGHGTIVNEGTIYADYTGVSNYGLALDSSSFTNAGTITVGTSTTLYLGNDGTEWSNSGQITVEKNATLNLGGSFDTASLTGISNDSGTVAIVGTLDNSGGTLEVGAGSALGPVGLLDGVIEGGTIVDGGDGLTFNYGTLDGVVQYDGTIDLSQTSAYLTVTDSTSMTLAGSDGTGRATIDLTGANSTLAFADAYTLDNAVVTIGSSEGDTLEDNGTALTLGPNLIIDQVGSSATIEQYSGGGVEAAVVFAADVPSGGPDAILNEGTIDAEGGGTLLIETQSFTNEGAITVGAGTDLVVSGDVSIAAAGSLTIDDGGAAYLSFSDDYDGLESDIYDQVTNAGTIAVETGGALYLGGSFTDASLTSIAHSGGTITIDGLLYNTGSSLPIETSTGVVLGPEGMIVGGAIGDDGGGLVFQGGTLEGVTYAGTITLTSGESLTLALSPAPASPPPVAPPSPPDAVQVDTGATLSLSGYDLTLAAFDDITNDGGTLAIIGALTLTADQTLTIAPGNTLALAQGGIVSGGTIDDQGKFLIEDGTLDGVDVTVGDGATAEVVADGTLYLQGNLPSAFLTTFTNNGTIDIEGTLDNSGHTLDVGSSSPLGQLALGSGGIIEGGTIADSGGGLLFQYGTLDGVTYEGTLGIGRGDVYVADGLTVEQTDGTTPGTVTLTGGSVTFLGTQTFDNATISMDGGSIELEGTSAVVLTLGPHLAIDGTSTYSGSAVAFASNAYYDESIVNEGQISDSSSRLDITGNFTNDGTLTAAYLDASSGTFTNDGTLDALYFGVNYLDGTFDNAATGQVTAESGTFLQIGAPGSTWSNEGTITVDVNTQVNLEGSFDTASLAGFVNDSNAYYDLNIVGTLDNSGGTLTVGSGTSLGDIQLGGFGPYGAALSGTIVGGTVLDKGSGLFFNGATLDGVTYRGTIDLSNDDGDVAPLEIVGGLTAETEDGAQPGTILLTGYDKVIAFDGTQTVDDVSIDIGNNSPLEAYPTQDYLEVGGLNGTAGTLTLGSGAEIEQSGEYATVTSADTDGDEIINEGQIDATYSDGHFVIAAGSATTVDGAIVATPLAFSNEGTLTVGNGGTLAVEPTTFLNLSGAVLTGGTYDVEAGSTLLLGGGDEIGILDAHLTLGGTGAIVENAQGTQLGAMLTAIGGAGDLALLGGASLTLTSDLSDAGILQLGGGTLSAAGLSIADTGMLEGFGTVSDLANAGAIDAAGGTLHITGAITGAGTISIAADAGLELGGATGETVSFEDAAGSLELDDPVGFTGGFTALAAGDIIDLVDTTASSSVTAGIEDKLNTALQQEDTNDDKTLTYAAQGDGNDGTDLVVSSQANTTSEAVATLVTANPLALPNVRVNALDAEALTIKNSASPPADALDASLGTVTGVTASGSIVDLAAGQTNSTGIVVGIPTGSAGLHSGTVVLDFASVANGGATTPLPSDTLDVSGKVYRLAQPSVGALPNEIVHVGSPTLVEPLTISNIAAADGYSENLLASLQGESGNGLSVGGTAALVTPGQSTNNLSVNITTGTARTLSGAVTIDFASDGSGIDGLGSTGDGSLTIPVDVTVNNYADPTIQQVAKQGDQAVGGLHQTGPDSYMYSFGPIPQFSPPETVGLGVLNAALAPADNLAGGFTVTASSLGGTPPQFFTNSFSPFAGLAPGKSDDNFSVTLAPNTAGTLVEYVTLKPTGSNASGYEGSLSPVSLEIEANVFPGGPDLAEADIDDIDFHDVHTEYPGQVWPVGPNASATQNVVITNSASPGDAGLDVAVGYSPPGVVVTGGVTDLSPGQTTPNAAGGITATLAYPLQPSGTIPVGQFAGNITLGLASRFSPPSGPQIVNMGTKQVPYSGTLYEYSDPLVTYSTSNGQSGTLAMHANSPFSTINLPNSPTTIDFTVSNARQGPTTYIDSLTAAFSPSGSPPGFTNQLSATPTLSAGETTSAWAVHWDPGQAGPGNTTETVTLTETNNSAVAGFSGQIDPEIEIIGMGPPPSPPSPPPPPPSSHPPPPPQPNPGNPGGWGDVHLVTFDGLHYNFQAAGEYIAAQATDLTSDPFAVQIRLQPYYTGASVSVVTQLAALIGTDRVTFDTSRAANGDGFVWVNGAAVTLGASDPTLALTGGELQYLSPTSYRLTYDTGQSLLIGNAGGYVDYNITLGPNVAPGSIEGLLGNDSGAQKLELGPASPQAGTVLTSPISTAELYGQYANSWLVSPSANLFDGQDPAFYNVPGFPTTPLSVSQLPTAVVREATLLAQAAGITDPTLLQDAILDFAETGNPAFITSAATLQAEGENNPNAVDADISSPPVVAVGVAAPTASAPEAGSGPTVVDFSAYRIGSTADALTVDWAVIDPGAGYVGTSAFTGGVLPTGTVSFIAGQSTASFGVTITGNIGTAPVEALQVAISTTADSGVGIVAPTAQTDIVNTVSEPGPPPSVGLELVEGSGTLTESNGSWTLDLGGIGKGTTPSPIELAVVNTATAPADSLSGQIVAATANPGFTETAGYSFANVAPGKVTDATIITINTSALGEQLGNFLVETDDVNASGYLRALPDETLDIVDDVVPAPTITASPSLTVIAGTPTSLGTVEVANAAESRDTLSATLTDATGTLAAEASGSGTVAGDDSAELTLTGTLAELNSELASVTYAGASPGAGRNATAADTITLTVLDEQDEASVTASIAVTIDQAPFLSWTHAESGSWNVADNWAPNAVPSTSSAAVITVSGSYTVTSAQSNTVGSLSVTDAGATLAIADTEGGAGTVFTVGSYDQTAGAVDIAAGSALILTGAGSSTIAAASPSAAAVIIDGAGVALNRGQLTIAGLAVDGSAILRNGVGGTLTQDGGLSIAAGAQVQNHAGGVYDLEDASIFGSGSFVNGGSVISTGIDTITARFSEQATGDVSVASGGLVLTGSSGSLAGTLTSSAGGALTNDGMLVVSGLAVAGDAYLRNGVSGTLTQDDGLSIAAGAQVQNHAGGVYDLDDASISGSGGFSDGGTIVSAGIDTITARFSEKATGDVTVASGGLVLMGSSGSLAGTLTSSAGGALTNDGTLVVSGLAVAGDAYLRNGVSGTLTQDGGLSIAAGAQVQNHAGGVYDLDDASISGSGGFSDGGTIVSAGIDTITARFSEKATGDVTVASGGLALMGSSGSLAGTLTSSAGGALTNDGTLVVSGLAVAGDAYLRNGVSGTLTQDGGLSIAAGAQVQNHAGGVYDLDDASISGSGGFSDGGTIVSAGIDTITARFSEKATGDVTVASGGLALMGSSGSLAGTLTSSAGGALTNDGTLVVSGLAVAGDAYLRNGVSGTLTQDGGLSIAAGAQVQNHAGGVYDLDDASISGSGGFSNGGTVIASGTATVAATFTNKGTVSVGTGSLDFSAGGLINSGSLEATGGATLTAEGSVTNTGTLLADMGNLTIDGALTGTGSASISGGTLDLGSTVSNGQTVSFVSSASGTLDLGQAQNFAGVVAGLATGNAIDLSNFLASGNPLITNVSGTGLQNTDTDVTVQDGALSVTLDLLNQFAGQYLAASSDYQLVSDNKAGASSGTLFELATHV